MATRHYHYHVSFDDGNQRQLDSTPWTDQQAALRACSRYFTDDEQPEVVKLDATETCGEPTHQY